MQQGLRNNLKNDTFQSARSRGKYQKQAFYSRDDFDSLEELKVEYAKIKKLLKQTQAKRTLVTKECSEQVRKAQQLQNQNRILRKKLYEVGQKGEGEKLRVDELKFLNKQFSSEIEQLRNDNQQLSDKLRYSNQILERKYEELQQKTYKRIEHAMKRLKKGVHYLQTLTAKQIDKTRQILIDNLRKASQLLRGKSYQESCQSQIQQLMNPLRNMQQQISYQTKEINSLKNQNSRLMEQISKYKSIEKQHMPIYKEAIEKLKKNLAQVRSQLSENEYDKMQIKKKYEEKLRQSEHKYNQLYKQFRKIKLERKIYQNKLEELEADVEEEKERLLGENQMLKKLYRKQEESIDSKISDYSQYKYADFTKEKRTLEKKMKKNYSSNQLKSSTIQQRPSFYDSRKKLEEVQDYSPQIYQEESSMVSQESLKHQICKIDEEIMEIQKNLTQQLQAYQ